VSEVSAWACVAGPAGVQEEAAGAAGEDVGWICEDVDGR